MEKLNERIDSFQKALGTLEEILKQENTEIVRDASIQRFEYTVEAMWKALKGYLLEFEGVDAQTPKSCIRAAMQSKILSPDYTEILLKMIDDRNLTSHTYIEGIAASIYSRLPEYVPLMKKVLHAIDPKFK
jgi:nucleotidyltransferase substrate binding protein (TIGR01987 family)